ncbi:MAG: hypothetical protein ACRDK3_15615, partial [Actinomycetota bacterium]
GMRVTFAMAVPSFTQPEHYHGVAGLRRRAATFNFNGAGDNLQMVTASHKRPKAFAQLVVTIQYGSKMLETLRSDLSRR